VVGSGVPASTAIQTPASDPQVTTTGPASAGGATLVDEGVEPFVVVVMGGDDDVEVGVAVDDGLGAPPPLPAVKAGVHARKASGRRPARSVEERKLRKLFIEDLPITIQEGSFIARSGRLRVP
jgi:hypothetical protein